MNRRLPIIDARLEYERTITALRSAARRLGYALAVHGSLARDIDIVAAPWTADATDAATLAEALRATAEDVRGHLAFLKDGDPVERPHGRLCWVLYFCASSTYIDLSVMPRRAQEAA